MIGGWSILHHLKRLVAWTKGTQGTNVLLGWFHDAAFESFKEATSSDSLQRVNALGLSKKLQVCSFILDSFSLNCGLIGHDQCHIITYHRLRFFSSYWHGVFVIILVPVLGVPWLFAVWAPFFASFCINVFLATPPTLATCLASKCLSVRWESSIHRAHGLHGFGVTDLTCQGLHCLTSSKRFCELQTWSLSV